MENDQSFDEEDDEDEEEEEEEAVPASKKRSIPFAAAKFQVCLSFNKPHQVPCRKTSVWTKPDLISTEKN